MKVVKGKDFTTINEGANSFAIGTEPNKGGAVGGILLLVSTDHRGDSNDCLTYYFPVIEPGEITVGDLVKLFEGYIQSADSPLDLVDIHFTVIPCLVDSMEDGVVTTVVSMYSEHKVNLKRKDLV